MNNEVIKSALIAYLNAELTDEERIAASNELRKLEEISKSFWSEFLSQDEELAHSYSDALEAQGCGFYESLPVF